MGEYGEDHMVDVIEMPFDNEGEKIAFAVKQNIAHGLPLDGISKRNALFKLSELGWTPERLAGLFGVSVKRIEKWGEEYVVIRGKPAPVKAGIEHLHGKRMSQDVYERHRKRDVGLPAYQLADQLMRWIKDGLVNMEDEKNIESLRALKAELENIQL